MGCLNYLGATAKESLGAENLKLVPVWAKKEGFGNNPQALAGAKIFAEVGCFFFSSRRRHTRFDCDWSSDVCSSDLFVLEIAELQEVQDAVFDRVGGAVHHGRARAKAHLVRDAHDLEPHVARALRLRDQIGRASCREKV